MSFSQGVCHSWHWYKFAGCLQYFADKGRSHAAYHRAVIELKADLGADRQRVAATINDEMVAAGTDNIDAGWR